MSLTDAQLQIDLTDIFGCLAGTSAAEDATIYEADGTTERGSWGIIRATTLSSHELRNSGWAEQYQHSIYFKTGDNVSISIDDVVVLTDGRFRVLNIHNGPAKAYLRADLSGEWGDII